MSLDYRDFQYTSVQAVVFTSVVQNATSRILAAMLENWQDLFDADPLVLPVEPVGNMGVMLLKSKDGRYVVEIINNQFRFARARIKRDDTVDLSEFVSISNRVIETFIEAAQATVNRVALLVTRVVDEDSPAIVLSRYFCNDPLLTGALRRPENFELHAHKTYELSGMGRINSWVRCKTAILQVPSESTPTVDMQPVIVIEQDINTLAEVAPGTELSILQIHQFYEAATIEMDSIVRLYFPGGHVDNEQ